MLLNGKLYRYENHGWLLLKNTSGAVSDKLSYGDIFLLTNYEIVMGGWATKITLVRGDSVFHCTISSYMSQFLKEFTGNEANLS